MPTMETLPIPSRKTPCLTGVTIRILLSPLPSPSGQLPESVTHVDAGKFIAEYLPRHADQCKVILNGGVIPPENYARVTLHDGDELIIRPDWQALTVALLAIGIGLSIASSFLFRPKPPSVHDEERTFSFGGIRSALRGGSVVPIVLGRHRVGAQYISRSVSYRAIHSNQQIASTTVNISNVTGGDVLDGHGGDEGDDTVRPITVTTATPHGLTSGDRIRITGVQGKTRTNGVWTVTASGVVMVLHNSSGIDGSAYTGGGTVTREGPVRLGENVQSSTFTMLGALCEGPVSAIDIDSVEIDGQPAKNYPDVQIETRLGTDNQTVIPGFEAVRNSFADGREITDAGGITYTTTQDINGFVLNIDFPTGLAEITSKGSIRANYVTLRYRYRVSPAGSWSSYTTVRVTGENINEVRFGAESINIALDTYDINVEWTEKLRDEVNDRHEVRLTSVTEIVNSLNAYPNTALIAVRGIATEDIQGDFPDITVVVDGLLVRNGGFNTEKSFTQNPAWNAMEILTNPRIGLGIPDGEIDLQAFAQWATRANDDVSGDLRHTLNYVLDREVREQTLLQEITEGSGVELINAEGLWTPRLLQEEIPLRNLSASQVTDLVITYIRDEEQTNVIDVAYTDQDDDYKLSTLSWPDIADFPEVVHKASLQLRGVTKSAEVQRYAERKLNELRIPRRTLTCKASLEAFDRQKYDTIYFSHPLPGWGTSGRVAISADNSITHVELDKAVTFVAGKTYHLYVQHTDDTRELRDVIHPGAGDFTSVDLVSALTQTPEATNQRMASWAFGESSPIDKAVVPFRIKNLRLVGDNQIEIEAIEHNNSIYTDPVATPLPVVTNLPNPTGVPPQLVSLTAREAPHVLPTGHSFIAVHLDWRVGPPQAGFAPYGGAIILRRVVTSNATFNLGSFDDVGFNEIISALDDGANYVRIASVDQTTYHFVDATVIQGQTYQYRVIPVSAKFGVANHLGVLTATIRVEGPTTAGFFPGTPQNLRLEGRPLSVTQEVFVDADFIDVGFGQVLISAFEFEGADITVEWDPIAENDLFQDTFIVKDYLVQIWGASASSNESFQLHPRTLGAYHCVTDTRFHYPINLNIDDAALLNLPAQRTLTFKVWARTTSGLISLVPAVQTFSNPPPDMSNLNPIVTADIGAFIVSWQAFVEPRDLVRYDVQVDTINPPQKVEATASKGIQKFIIPDLVPGINYFIRVTPFDEFGAGLPTQVVESTPRSAAEVFSFFVREIIPEGIEFTPNPTNDTVSWTAGTVRYTNDLQQVGTRSIVAGSASHVGTSLFITYILGDKFFEATSNPIVAFESAKRIMAVYNGGTALHVFFGDVKIHGDSLIAGTIGAANLITGTAVITQSAQIAAAIIDTASIALAAIGTAQIQDAAITRAKIVDAIIDTAAIQNGVITNAKMATASIGEAQIISASITNAKIANAAISAAQIQDAAITNAKIGNLAVDTLKIAGLAVSTDKVQDNAITEIFTVSALGNRQINIQAETVVQTLTVISVGGSVALLGKIDIQTEDSSANIDFNCRLRKGSITGPILDQSSGTTDDDTRWENVALMATDTSPAATQSYVITLRRTGGDAGDLACDNVHSRGENFRK